MKYLIEKLVQDALAALPEDLRAVAATQAAPTLERTRDPTHGDFATNVAMRLAKAAKRKPRELAQAIVDALPASELVAQVEIAGAGFINFFLAPAALPPRARARARRWALPTVAARCGGRQRVLVEFVSANPTGPLHVGHGRHAAFGATLANLLDAAGFAVHREYYINDAGRQMDILAVSVWLRYLEACGEQFRVPEQRLPRRLPAPDRRQAASSAPGARWCGPRREVFRDLPPDAPDAATRTPTSTR